MDNTEEILSNFGGVITNDLNNVLQNDEDDETPTAFSRSLYIDLNQKNPLDLPQRKTFNVLSINIQSINAKFNNLLLYLSILEEKKYLLMRSIFKRPGFRLRTSLKKT